MYVQHCHHSHSPPPRTQSPSVAMKKGYTLFIVILFLLLPVSIYGECTCEPEAEESNKPEALKYKLAVIALILFAGAVGVSLPVSGKMVAAFHPDSDLFFLIKAFAAGKILSTGFIHVLPEAFENLTSPCLPDNPWGNFPFTGLVAMLSAIGTLMIDAFATAYYRQGQLTGMKRLRGSMYYGGHVHIHTYATHGHAHGPAFGLQEDSASPDLLRHRIMSQVLELGIVVHSVIIGISLGASESPKIIKRLVPALTFHQFFEGMGLGGCISQAKFKARAVTLMAIFFSLTTPVGIAIGFGISNIYNENGPTALIVEGIFNSASAGILIYMAFVHLLAAHFLNPRMQNNLKLQLSANLSLLLGSGFMSLLAKWG